MLFCAACGFPQEPEDLFCRRCGHETPAGAEAEVRIRKRLRRATDDRKLAGVCSGVARYLGKNPRTVRALWAGASLLPFSPGLIAYGVCWAFMPKSKRPPSDSANPAP